jgi:hypothetical protein
VSLEIKANLILFWVFIGMVLIMRTLRVIQKAIIELHIDVELARRQSHATTELAKHLASRPHGLVHTDDLRS